MTRGARTGLLVGLGVGFAFGASTGCLFRF